MAEEAPEESKIEEDEAEKTGGIDRKRPSMLVLVVTILLIVLSLLPLIPTMDSKPGKGSTKQSSEAED